jgi:hypothetical protein
VIPNPYLINRYPRLVAGYVLDFISFLEHKFSLFLICQSSPRDTFPIDIDLRVGKESSVAVYAVYVNSPNDYSSAIKVILVLRKYFDHVIVVNTGEFNFGPISGSLVLNRENIGRDLYSYRCGIQCIENVETLGIKNLLLLNDSVNWSSGALENVFAKIQNLEGDVFGLTDSYQKGYHLQSYFIYLRNPSVETLRGLMTIRAYKMKRTLVKYVERGLTKQFTMSGLKIFALFPYEDLKKSVDSYYNNRSPDLIDMKKCAEKGIYLNPSIHYWKVLLDKGGFIKKSIESNPARLKELPRL